MLDINLLGALSRKGSDQLELVAKSLLVFLELVSKSVEGIVLTLMTYLEFLLIHEIFTSLSATEEQQSLANVDAIAGQLSTFLDETTERSDTSTRTNHDDRLAGIRR